MPFFQTDIAVTFSLYIDLFSLCTVKKVTEKLLNAVWREVILSERNSFFFLLMLDLLLN